VDAQDHYGRAALMLAAGRRDTQCVRALVEAGACLEINDDEKAVLDCDAYRL
jgi:ankyrin repeat protein